MNPVDKEKQTIDFYDRKAEEWANAHSGYEKVSWWKDEMQIFHKLLPRGKILEIGAGTGRDASNLIDLGYNYTGTDASFGLLEIAKKRNPQINFKLVGVCELNFPKHEFDGFWTVATLLHIPKDTIDKALQTIRTQVKPNGIGFISLKAGAGEREDPETGRWFSYYSLKEFKKILEKNGFEVIKQKTRKGERDWWLCYWIKTKANI